MIFSKKKKELLSVCDGEVINISKIPDDVFSQGMLGKGYGIKPTDGVFFSPVSGTVEVVTDTYHAYSIRTDDGLGILIHIGVDTVALQGKGFFPSVVEGQRVKGGQVIARADLDYISSMGYPTVTAVLVTDSEKISDVEYIFGMADGGRSAVMLYRAERK